MSSVNRFAARGWLTGYDGGTAVRVQQCAHAHTHTLAITLSETRYRNLLLITLHVPYNEAFPEVCHFDCIFSSIHSTPPSNPLKHSITLTQIFLEYSSHLKILGTKKETWSQLRTADQNILGANVHSSVATIRASLIQDLLSGLCSHKQHVGHPASGDFKGKGKVYPRTGHEGQKGEERYSSTFFLNLGARWGVWSKPRASCFTPGKDPVSIE